MKFKIYGWNAIYRQDDYSDIHIDILPNICLSWSHHDFPPDENCSYQRKGTNYFLMFSWFLWGITFDLRTGTDTGIG